MPKSPGRPKIYENSAERVRATRARQRDRLARNAYLERVEAAARTLVTCDLAQMDEAFLTLERALDNGAH